jgi:hypothetical protein
MFTKEEVKEFVIKYGKKWLFPDFYNKVTWYVVTLGAGIILTPTPFKLVVYNWIIESFNLNLGNALTLSEMGYSTADYWLGFAIIISALLHNVFSKWLLYQNDIKDMVKAEKVSAVDKALFKEFLEIFASSSRSAHLLETHGFENSFSLESLKNIDKFVDEWNFPEKSFINPELEAIRKVLWNKCHEFRLLIATKSSPIHGGSQSVVPDRVRGDLYYPEWVDNDVKAVNEMASEVFSLHQGFIKSMREDLKC